MATTTSTESTAPAIEQPPTSDAELPMDVVFDLLSSERRRQTLRYLDEEARSGTATLSDLAEHIASLENDKSVAALSSSERKRVYISLYQCHLPKLDDADVIDFDSDRKTLELDPHAEEVMRYLPEEVEQNGGRPENGHSSLMASVVSWLTSTG